MKTALIILGTLIITGIVYAVFFYQKPDTRTPLKQYLDEFYAKRTGPVQQYQGAANEMTALTNLPDNIKKSLLGI